MLTQEKWALLSASVFSKQPMKHVTKSCMDKLSIQRDRPNNFNLSGYEHSWILFKVSHYNSFLRNYKLLNIGMVVGRNIHNYLKSLVKYFFLKHTYICVSINFLHIHQSKQPTATGWNQKQWESNCFLLSQTLDLQKWKATHSYFWGLENRYFSLKTCYLC